MHPSPLPDVEIPRVPLTPYVLERVTEFADKPALIDGPTGRTLTFAQLDQAIRSAAGGILAAGLDPGDVVAIMAPNIPEYAVAFHGVAMAGGVATTINPTYTPQEVHHQLRDAGARWVITIEMFVPSASAAAEHTNVTDIFVIGGTPPEGTRPFSDLMGAPVEAQVPRNDDDVVALPYSSGTTGLSKGVMLTHRNLVANVAQSVDSVQIASSDVMIAVLPFFHIYGMQVLMNLALRQGATLVTMPRFDLEVFLSLHQEHKITRSFVAPPIVLALAKHPMVDQYDLSSLKQVFSGAAPLSEEVANLCATRLGCEVAQGYGMTEMSPVSHCTLLGDVKPGSVGVTIPNTEMRIVSVLDGTDQGVDSEGEIWIRGPQVMKGYLNNEKATSETIDEDGWLHTGDIGYVDVDGHVFIVDRLKELIKYKGFQVPPAELEAILLRHESVADAAVVGIADEEAGELPVGYVVLKQGAAASAAEIMEFVTANVASYKKLHQVHFIEEVPKSASGKILRRMLREEPS